MPAKREDLLYSGIRILSAIMRGTAEATPLYAKRSNLLNHRPSVIILWSPLRLRLQPKSLTLRSRYERCHEGRWDNRTTIGPCVLNSFWRPVKEADPDYQKILGMSTEEQRDYGVISTNQGLKRLTYQVVRDLVSSIRQPSHVTDSYDAERAELHRQQLVAQQTFRDARAGATTLSPQEISQLLDGIYHRSVRLYKIERIYDDRVLRGARLSDQLIMATVQLQQISEALMRFALEVSRPDGPRREVIDWKLRHFQDQIGSFTTSEVRSKTRLSARLLRQVRSGINESMPPDLACERLLAAAKLAQEASTILTNWSGKLLEVA